MPREPLDQGITHDLLQAEALRDADDDGQHGHYGERRAVGQRARQRTYALLDIAEDRHVEHAQRRDPIAPRRAEALGTKAPHIEAEEAIAPEA